MGHETEERGLALSTLVTVQSEAPPVGLVEVTTFPATSPATQSVAVAQEMDARKSSEPSTWTVIHVEAPPVGLVEVTTSGCRLVPLTEKPAAAQNEMDGQEMDAR